MNITNLNQFLGRTVILRMFNGEVVKVKVDFVDEDDEIIVAAVLESSHSEHYRYPCAMHTFAASEIASAELSD